MNPYKRFSFKRKVVVITGGAGGIGRSLALKLSSMGARIVILDIDQEQMSALEHKVGQGSAVVKSYLCDVTHETRVKEVMEQIVTEFGHIDVLVNNAGITHNSLFIDTPLSVVDKVFSVNFFGALNCTKYALPSLVAQKGMIITLSSVSGLVPMRYRSGYNASKHALHGLFESLRWELKSSGVHVMLVCPGYTETDLHKKALLGSGNSGKAPVSLLGKLSTPGDVADAIYDGACSKQRLLILSNVGKRVRWLALFLPRLYEHWIEISR